MTSDLEDFLPPWAKKPKPPETTPPAAGQKPPGKPVETPTSPSSPTPPSLKPGQETPYRKVNLRLPEEVRAQTYKINNSKFGFNKKTVNLDWGMAVGMAKGTILKLNRLRGTGLIKVGETVHPFEDNRHIVIRKTVPLINFLEQELLFTFYPTLTHKSAPHLKASDPVRLKIAGHRKTLPFPNAVEIMGMIYRFREGYFVVSFFSGTAKKVYLVNVHGECPGQIGDVVFLRAILDQGIIRLKKHQIIYARDRIDPNPDPVAASGAPSTRDK